jgi:crotonobetainyl-CoA:carnitine CoA-transferase CaiB-like acyl-CoA transferase
MSKSDARYERIPALGENSEAILQEIGYDTGTIESLKQDKVI